ncbi:MAG: hypothetical protein OXG35_05560 [Acidobacteria bacterium]|nr:hypothetical protein [Acidobacteriota bacterium]
MSCGRRWPRCTERLGPTSRTAELLKGVCDVDLDALDIELS